MSELRQLEERLEALRGESERQSSLLRVIVGDAFGGNVDAACQGLDEKLANRLREAKVNDMIEEQEGVDVIVMTAFLTAAIAELSEPDLLDKAENVATQQETLGKSRLDVAKDFLAELYASIWTRYHVSQQVGESCCENAGLMAESDDLSQEDASQLQDLVEEFQEQEQQFVGPIVLGREEFAKRWSQQKRFLQVREEIVAVIQAIGDDEAEFEAYIDEVQNEALQVQKKIRGFASKEEQQAYIADPDPEDEYRLMRMQALQIMMQGGGHGHSHNGAPCHGHGGHEEDEDEHHGGHGHSHGGEPCHGHGGHDDDEEEDDSEEDDHSHSHSHQQAHGHSHGGKPCHGHGH